MATEKVGTNYNDVQCTGRLGVRVTLVEKWHDREPFRGGIGCSFETDREEEPLDDFVDFLRLVEAVL